MITAYVERSEAVRRIGDVIADCGGLVIMLPLEALARFADQLSERVPRWTAYVDAGTRNIVQTDEPPTIHLWNANTYADAVLTVPLTVSPQVVGEVFGRDWPADGSRSLIDFSPVDATAEHCPRLFFDALEAAYPVVGAQIRAKYPEAPPGAIEC